MMWMAKDKDGKVHLFNDYPMINDPADTEGMSEEQKNILHMFGKKGRFWTPYPSVSSVCVLDDIYTSYMRIPDEDFPENRDGSKPVKVWLADETYNMKLIEDVCDYIRRFGIDSTTEASVYESLFADVMSK